MKEILQYKQIHLIGIGGIGMSAMAKFLRYHNIKITGSDLSESEITDDLRARYDIPIFIGASSENITDKHDAIIYSPAIPLDNIERQEGQDRNIPEFSYPELLGLISNQMKTIAVAGTNGKTTTTSMTIEVLKHLGIDPTGIVGAILQKYNSNFVSGQSEYFVTEACEYKDSFLSISHDILAITNISEDHLDYFKDLEHIQETFKKFLSNKKNSGILVCNTELQTLEPIITQARNIGMKIIDYGKYLNKDITLSIPGKHNLQNAATTFGIIEALELPVEDAKEYLAKHFSGAKRRMEHVGMMASGIQIFDDYAHNPEGLDYLIDGLRDFYPEKKIIMFFEPHLYSRTRDFKNEFARALEKVDILYLFPTYRAREAEILQENFLLEQYIDNSKVELITVVEPEKFVKNFQAMHFNSDYLVISAGAGDVWQFSHALKNTK